MKAKERLQMKKIYIATIQTNTNAFEKKVIFDPTDCNGTVLLDICPRGTLHVNSFHSIKDAAKFMSRSEATVRRQLRNAQNAETEMIERYLI